MKLIALSLTLAVLYPAVAVVANPAASLAPAASAAPADGNGGCETGTNHRLGGDCHNSVGDFACSPAGNVVSHYL